MKRGCRRLWPVILLLWLASPVCAWGEALLLRHGGGELPLDGHLFAYRDADASLTLAEVLRPDADLPFIPLSHGLFAGFDRHAAIWLRTAVTVPAGSAGDWWLVLDAPWIEHLDIWITPSGSGEVLWQHRTGMLYPLASRDLRLGHTALRVPLEAGDYRLLMRVRSDRALLLRGAFWELPALVTARSREEGLLLCMLGMMLLMVFIGLVLGARLGDRGMAWYGLYVLSMTVGSLGAHGFMISLLLPEHPVLGARLSAVAISFSVYAAARVVVLVFGLDRLAPRLARLVTGIGLSGLVSMALAAVGQYGLVAPLVNMLGIVGGVMALAIAAWVLWRHYTTEAVLYTLALLLYAVPVALSVLQYMDVLHIRGLPPLLQQAMSVSHVFLVLMSLAVRIQSLRRIERRAEEERLRLAVEMRAQLEQQVAARTSELNDELLARRQAEKRLGDMLTEQRSFLAMVSHEFRTPLTVMSLVAYNIGRRHGEDEQTREDVARVARANERLVSLVDACLSNEWLDSAEMQLRREWQDLVPLLRELCEQRRLATGRDIHTDLPEQSVFAEIDGTLVQVVFDNLLGNAIKYSPPEEPITVAMRRMASGAVEVSVTDRGPGIRPAERESIFERYYRSPEALGHTGIGLGLHIVRRIIGLHGGDTWLDARYREGARFVVRFPPSERPGQGDQLISSRLPGSVRTEAP